MVSTDFDASFLICHFRALCLCGQDAIYDNKGVPKNKFVNNKEVCFTALSQEIKKEE